LKDGRKNLFPLIPSKISFMIIYAHTLLETDGKKRCFGSGPGKGFYAHYHDEEWSIPSHDDRHLFEMLIFEGAQAGLS